MFREILYQKQKDDNYNHNNTQNTYKTQTYAAYKKLTLPVKTHIKTEGKGMKKVILCKWKTESEVVTLMSDKVDFSSKPEKRDK